MTAASRSGLFCASSHFWRGDFFFFRLKKQQHLKDEKGSVIEAGGAMIIELTLCRQPFQLQAAEWSECWSDRPWDHRRSTRHWWSSPPVKSTQKSHEVRSKKPLRSYFNICFCWRISKHLDVTFLRLYLIRMKR